MARVLVFSALPVLLVAGALTDGDGMTETVGGLLFSVYGIAVLALMTYARGRAAVWGAFEAQSAYMQAAVHRISLMLRR